MQRSILLAAGFCCAAASTAFAHTGAGVAHTTGLTAGFGHPIGGLDHILAMVAVGILAAQMGGKSIWTVPAAFVAMMLVGGAAAMAGMALPFVEIGIVGSIVVLGAVIAFGRHLPMVGAMALVGGLALFHGHAHGTEMPGTASGIQYAVGFVLATGLLHAAGIALGLSVRKLADRAAPTLIRAGGGAVMAAGATLFVV